MKKILSSLVAAALFITVLHAQTAGEKAITGKMEAMRQALLKPDSATLAGLVDDNLTYGHSTGLIEDKKAFIEDLVTGKTVFNTLSFSEQTVKITGNIALVRNRFTGDVTSNGTPKKIDIIVLLVWRKQKEGWRLLARQGVKIPPAQ